MHFRDQLHPEYRTRRIRGILVIPPTQTDLSVSHWIVLLCSECDYPISLAIDTANQRVVIKNSPSQHTFHNISFELSLNLSASSQAIKWEGKITTRTCHCCLLTLTQNQFAGDATYLCEFQYKPKLRQRSWAQSQRESLTNYYISFYNAQIDQARPQDHCNSEKNDRVRLIYYRHGWWWWWRTITRTQMGILESSPMLTCRINGWRNTHKFNLSRWSMNIKLLIYLHIQSPLLRNNNINKGGG